MLLHPISFMERKPRAVLTLILLVAVVVRLGFWFAVVGFDTTGGGDEPDYHMLATVISEGGGFVNPLGEPTAARPPLYPALLGGLYAIAGPDPDVGRAFQVALGVLIVFLVYALARRLFSTKVALLAAGLAAVNPGLIYLSVLLMTENLYVVLLLLLLIVMVGEWKNPARTTSRFALAGLLAGLCSLARPTAFTIALLLSGATLVLARETLSSRLKKTVVFMLVTVALVAPWSVRNYVQMGDWVTFTTHGGITFYESNNMLNYEVPEFRGIVVLPRRAVPNWDQLAGLPEAEHDRRAWEMGLDFIREHPRHFARMAWWKFARFWRVGSGLDLAGAAGLDSSDGGFVARVASRVDIFALYWIPVLPLFVLGLLTTLRHYRKLLPLYVVVATHVLLSLIFHGSLRARMPIEPIITILAAAAIAWIAAAVAGHCAVGGRHP